ncbi:MAG: sulfatase-like hydrolase/transferase [Gordonia sp. (in: high G+C Gram-positive bacteria)]
MATEKRPNIVLFQPDQLRADALGAYGNPHAKTPNIDRFAAGGTIFDQVFVQHSVCAPSRTSMFSGTYPHTRGHRTLTHLLAADEFNVFRALKESGYHVTWSAPRGHTFAPGVGELSVSEYGFIEPPEINSTITQFADRADDPDVWSRLFYWGSRGDDVVVDYDEAAIRSAEQWLTCPPEQPWMLFIPLIFPHCPFRVEEPWFSLHDRATVPEPQGLKHEPTPRFIDAIRKEYGITDVTADMWREVIAVYYGMVSRIDDQFGRILAALPDPDNTVVLFSSDHGEYLGDYGLIEKWPAGLDEVLLRVPLIAGGPGVRAGQRHDALVEMLDITPTLLDIAGTDAGGATHFGRSLVGLLAGVVSDHRDFVFSEGGFRVEEEPLFETPPFPYDLKGKVQHDDPAAVGRAYALRNRDWTYIYRVYDTDELYDRRADPHELTNLIDTAGHREVVDLMRSQLLRTIATTNDIIAREDPERQYWLDLPSPADQLAARRAAADRLGNARAAVFDKALTE